MELKIKSSDWSAGIPVAMLNRKTARKLGVHPGDRITIKRLNKSQREISTIIDTVQGRMKEEYLGVTEEIKKELSLREGEKVEVFILPTTESINLIKKKLSGDKLKKEEIKKIISDISTNVLSEAEIAVFISAMYEKGMDFQETVGLIEAILLTGKIMKFGGRCVVDKHCIGGIAGNRTTPIVVAICAAAGLTFPKTSSRAITSAAGTADCIEVLAPVDLPMQKVEKIVKKVGACLTWGGSLEMVPADSKIIQIEKTLKIDPPAQLLASIMSKKLASGSKYILIDIPYGEGAKVTKRKAIKLKKKFEKLGEHFKLKLKAVLTHANEPIGRGVGPALEIMDVLKVLMIDKEAPKDLEEKSIFLAGKILELSGKVKKEKGEEFSRVLLYSGRAYKKFEEIIKAQGGKVVMPEFSKIKREIYSGKSGEIKEIKNKEINSLARVAGCPQDKFAGVYLHHHVGDKIKKGDKILTIYAESHPRIKGALKYYQKSDPIKI
ncbi:thymidine phosphorylase [Candidatus Pacearchaeota archaeon CG10_big_fil_rev_8_21_14_0_10_32_42]|nr:MAG: thymidine phosphorylase [Candidatus Pacearchaeota archaeon CG10_big_fil_rev_8_21_14_0_10_32_42]